MRSKAAQPAPMTRIELDHLLQKIRILRLSAADPPTPPSSIVVFALQAKDEARFWRTLGLASLDVEAGAALRSLPASPLSA
jgi:hypothetical protein